MKKNEFRLLKSVLDYLNREFPAIVEFNKMNNCLIRLQDKFSFCQLEHQWEIVCTDYWIFTSEEFKNIKEHLLTIATEEGVQLKFSFSHPSTQVVRKKDYIRNNKIYIGKLNIHTVS